MDEYPITMDQLYEVSKESTGVYYTHIMQVLSMMGYTGTLCPKEGLHRLILAGEQANKAFYENILNSKNNFFIRKNHSLQDSQTEKSLMV